MTSIASEAGPPLTDLLRRVRAGESIAITEHGEAVAYLVPVNEPAANNDLVAMATRWRAMRSGLNLVDVKTKDLISQGRR